MSGLEATGFALSSVALLLSGLEYGVAAKVTLHDAIIKYLQVYRKDGIIPLLLISLLPNAFATLDTLERALSKEKTDFVVVRTLLVSNLNMIAVAGAIFAQVGISALSLEAVGQVHWTASAFFVASLVLGIISVYASFIVQQELNGLLSNEEVADWCSRPLTEDEVLERAYALSNNPAFRLSDRPLPEHIPFQVSPQSGVNVSARLKREASVLAAIEVASPAGFLGLSLNAFIIGLGIYLGCVYTDDLISQYGRGGSLGILIFFLIASALGTFVYSFPSLLKASETKSGNKTSEQRKHLEQLAAAIARYHTERSTQNTTPSVVS